MAWELRLLQWGKGWWSTPVLDTLVPWITHIGSHVAVVLLILFTLILTRQRSLFYGLLFLYGIQSLIVYGLKFLIRRPRPFAFHGSSSSLFLGPGEILDPGFPSAHTVYAFMMATLLASLFPRYRILFFVTAGFVGWTRIYLGLHYPTDVLVGALLGYGVTRLILRWARFRSIRGVDLFSD